MKKFLALLTAVLMLLSLAACGGGENTPTDPPKVPEQTNGQKEPASPTQNTPDPALTVHENAFFTVAYNEKDGWTLSEEDYYFDSDGGYATLCILDEAGDVVIDVTIEAELDDPESFREELDYYEVDMMAYVAGEVETTDIGGQPMLLVDQGSDRYFYGRNEAAGVTYNIYACQWEDPRVPALVASITCTASGTDNIEPPWPWDGEPFSSENLSAAVGAYTVSAEFLPMSEPLATFETFNHDVEVIGDKVYLLSDYLLYEYALEDSGLTLLREIPLDDEYDFLESANGAMVLSSFMNPVIGHDGDSILYSYDGPDKFAVAPDGTWGISWFYDGDACEKYTFQDGGLVGQSFPFPEMKSVSHLCIDDSYIYVSGTPADDGDHQICVYDHSGNLQLELCGDPTSSFGLGSVTFTAKTANGFLAMDGNMREVVLWAADGTWLGAVEDGDLFGTYYPWFATGDVMDDGSILVVMTEDRADGSAMEAIAFKLSIS